MQPLPADWAARDATVVAPDLLYKLVEVHGRLARVTEVEAYTSDDPASHSSIGRTNRNASMFGPAGHWYVYFVYGVHHCLNLVTGAVGDGQAVLVRSVVLDDVPVERTTGPGRLTKVLGVDRSLDGARATVFDDGLACPPVVVTTRIGLTKGVDLPRRWAVEGVGRGNSRRRAAT